MMGTIGCIYIYIITIYMGGYRDSIGIYKVQGIKTESQVEKDMELGVMYIYREVRVEG